MQTCAFLNLFITLQMFFLSKTALPVVLFKAGLGGIAQRQAISIPSPKGGCHLFAGWLT